MIKKKNLDYTASAVNLTNPPDAANLLTTLQNCRIQLDDVLLDIEMTIPRELKAKRANLEAAIEQITTGLKRVIDEQGSYQDVEAGVYALKQRKVSKSYNAVNFEDAFPQFSPAVIVKMVDTAKLTGLVKGGLISEEDLRIKAIIQESETFAYIIR